MEEILTKLLQERKLYREMEYDSRKIEKGDLFVALKGAQADGHKFIGKAVELGAKGILHSDDVEKIPGITYYKIDNLRENLGRIASEFYNWPQKRLKVIGITGTNGKTTTSYLVETILGSEKVARIGTVEYKIGTEIIEAPNTTPESLDLVKFCRKAVERDIEYLVMEVSSHALMLGRVSMLTFDVAAFTNLTPEHLDFHKSMEEYFLAKRKIFQMLKKEEGEVVGIPVINMDDSYGAQYHKEFGGISYGIDRGELRGKYLENRDEVEFSYVPENGKEELRTVRKIKLLGRYNLYNILTAVGTGIALGINWGRIMERVEEMVGAPGRFETVDCGQEFTAIVDYAHTADALENLLKTVEDLKYKRVITLFGCGGDRDRGKRPEMAAVAEKYSDIVIVTADNPRTEDLDGIIPEILEGFKYMGKEIVVERDRERAIMKAVELARKGDIIAIAGKGHETYQILGTVKYHFDDREYLRREIVRKKQGSK